MPDGVIGLLEVVECEECVFFLQVVSPCRDFLKGCDVLLAAFLFLETILVWVEFVVLCQEDVYAIV